MSEASDFASSVVIALSYGGQKPRIEHLINPSPGMSRGQSTSVGRLSMSDSLLQEGHKHWFVIDNHLKGSLVDWLTRCPNPIICEGKRIRKPSTEFEHQCSYEIEDGATPETAGLILLKLYTDVPSLNQSFLGALRDHFKPSKSSEPL